MSQRPGTNEGPYDDPFTAFAEFAASPIRHPLPLPRQESTDSNKGKHLKPRPFSFFHGLHFPQSLSTSQSSTSSGPEDMNEPSTSSGSQDADGKKMVRRESFILSCGPNKYTYDSETVHMPFRSIDVYERQMSQEGNLSRTPSKASPNLNLMPQEAGGGGVGGPGIPHLTAVQKRELMSKRSSTRNSYHHPSPSHLSIDDRNIRSTSISPSIMGPSRRPFLSPSPSLSHPSSNPSSPVPATPYLMSSLTPSCPSPSPSASSRILKRASIVRSAKIDLPRPILVNGRFTNPWDTWMPNRFTNILRFGLTRNNSNIPNKEQLDIVLPIVKPAFDAKIPDNGMAVTWLGHSTVLVQMDGITFMTDPMMSDRASPSQMVGPKRYRDFPCSVHDLPSNLDAVVISHNHYDHLDMNSVTLLNARYGVDLRWFVPIGLGPWFESAGCDNVVQLDWWEENCVPDKNEVSFIFTPSQHWSKRTLNDDNKSLWGGFVVIGPRFRFYFSGPTGYCPVFKDIGRMYGPFTACAIPIGSSEPRWFMKYQHVSPQEAVMIHQDVRSPFTLAIHWGTFNLSNEYYLDPPVKLREAMDDKELPSDSFVTFKHGETRIISTDGSSVPAKSPRKHPRH